MRGRYLVLLNNDTVVTASWLDGLVAAAERRGPAVGLVGAVSNYASGPQDMPVPYKAGPEMHAFAARRRAEYAGKTLAADRLVGFCLLLRREVHERRAHGRAYEYSDAKCG